MEQPTEPMLREDLIHQGSISPEAPNRAVRSHLQAVLTRNVSRCLLTLSTVVDMMVLGFSMTCGWLIGFGSRFRWVRDHVVAEIILVECDQPLRLTFIMMLTVGVVKLSLSMLANACRRRGRHTLASCLHWLAWPLAVVPLLVWPLGTMVLVLRADQCGVQLKAMVWASIALYVLVLLATCFYFLRTTVLFLLYRYGLLSDPVARITRAYAQVQFCPETFQNCSGDGYPSCCPICLDDFSSTHDIVRTACPSRAHLFHRGCLAGWLQMSRSCPICRHEIASGTPNFREVSGMVQQIELSMNRFLRQTSLEHLATD